MKAISKLPRFALGKIVATPGALALMKELRIDALKLLLVVTDSTGRAVHLRTWLHEQPTPEPLHLITMTTGEDQKLIFIRHECAVQIFPTNEFGLPAGSLGVTMRSQQARR